MVIVDCESMVGDGLDLGIQEKEMKHSLGCQKLLNVLFNVQMIN